MTCRMKLRPTTEMRAAQATYTQSLLAADPFKGVAPVSLNRDHDKRVAAQAERAALHIEDAVTIESVIERLQRELAWIDRERKACPPLNDGYHALRSTIEEFEAAAKVARSRAGDPNA